MLETTRRRPGPDGGETVGPVLSGAGDCADRIRSRDWSGTAVGAAAGWDGAFAASLSLVLEARFPMFLTWGRDHQLFFNDAYAPIVADKGDCLGRPFKAVFPEAWPRIGQAFTEALGGSAAAGIDWEVPLIRDGGRLRTTHWIFSYSPARDSTGVVRGVLGVVHETTDRLRADRDLRQEGAALRAVADRAPVFLWQSDREGRLTWANTALQRYAGVALDGTATLDSLVHPEDRPAARVAWARSDASRQGPSSQGASDEGVAGRFRLLGRDGDCRWFLVGARPMSAPDGAEIGWCGSAVDVGDGVSLSAAEEEGSLVEAVRSASSGLLWILDADRGVVQGLNPEFASGWSLPANGAPAPWTDWLDALHPEDRAKVAAAMDEVLKGATRQGRIRFGAGEAMRCFHATAFPIAGAVRRVGGYLVDVTLPPTRRLYVLDGETASRERWGQIFSQAGFKVRSFPDLEAAMRLIPDLQPGVFILAGREDPGAIEQAAGALGLRARKIPWIAVGDFGEVATVVRLMRAGAVHVARENDPAWALIDAVQAAAPLIAGSRGDAADAARRLAGLTARERQVLDGLLAGGSNKSIAQTLGLSPRTVETYRGSLMDRLGARTLADLLRITAAGRGAGRDRRPD